MNLLFPYAYIAYIAAWVIFQAYWRLSSRHKKRDAFNINPSQGASLRLGIMVLVLVLLILGFFFTDASVVRNSALRIIGTITMLIGFGLAVWSKKQLGESWGLPMAKVTDGDLITSGPYRFFRHPIYVGVWLAMVGTALATNWHLLIIPLVCAVDFVHSAVNEERTLTQKFPKAYPAYRSRTIF